MNIPKIIISALFFISCTSGNLQRQKIFLDEKGNRVDSEEFQDRWRNSEVKYARWDYKTDSLRIATLSHPSYQQLTAPYAPLKNNLEKITGKKFPENTFFLLEYTYLDDLCSSRSTNNWNKKAIKARKKFLAPIKAELKSTHPQILYLNFFEEGIALQNNPSNPDEFFFSDPQNFLRESLFRNSSYCGSFALIKPNGQILLLNGENRADLVAKHLEPEVWNQLFPESR